MKDRLGLIRIIRPINSLMVGFAVIVGVIIGGGISVFNEVEPFYAFFTGFSLSASAMAINDFFDRNIDLINEPYRPIPSGAITPLEAIIWSFILAALGLLSAYMISTIHFILATLVWIVSCFYATIGKKTGFIGNIIVSACVALPFTYGGLIVGSKYEISLVYTLIAFLTNIGREVTKGIVDVEGDKKEGIRTPAIIYGGRVAAIISSLMYISAVLVSVIPIYLWNISIWYIIPITFTDFGLIYLSLSLIRNHSRENSRIVKNYVRLLMFLGMLGFLAGRIF